MREILFRAKAINRDPNREYRTNYENGDWVYGLITEPYNDKYDLPMEMKNTHGVSGIEVDYNTLSQYTGLLDSLQNKIFEGDVVTFEDVCCEDIPGYQCPDEWALDVINKAGIVIREGCVCFGKTLFQTSAYEDIRLHYPNIQKWFTECTKVIGNVYDNPELLERNNL